jgi:hypothetical protein
MEEVSLDRGPEEGLFTNCAQLHSLDRENPHRAVKNRQTEETWHRFANFTIPLFEISKIKKKIMRIYIWDTVLKLH